MSEFGYLVRHCVVGCALVLFSVSLCCGIGFGAFCIFDGEMFDG